LGGLLSSRDRCSLGGSELGCEGVPWSIRVSGFPGRPLIYACLVCPPRVASRLTVPANWRQWVTIGGTVRATRDGVGGGVTGGSGEMSRPWSLTVPLCSVVGQ
jgi:hypothetical protein